MFTVEYSKTSQKTLRRLPRNVMERILDKMDEIARNPFAKHNNATPLKGMPYHRLRVGDWRIIYEIQHERIVIFVLKIAPRGEVYK
ncbi:MAG: type II toxin-antitoxin system RelE/ParE family toxin [Chloroflexi bacterium]|nr:type II toxin-antitoxin system RelE/ParE family toxin [Chloroflexota bacterium]